ncbi:hypothetical protein H2248_012295 [Termitomyces sp. 'cryptogamus']|nr:hypothetical protein H2248_012295 [Termitomyces sp. 'cryptogamus']
MRQCDHHARDRSEKEKFPRCDGFGRRSRPSLTKQGRGTGRREDRRIIIITNGSWILLPQWWIIELLKENPEKHVLDLLNEPTYNYILLSIDKKSSIRCYEIVAGITML